MTTIENKCKYCGKPFIGRADKQFCSRTCKEKYRYKQNPNYEDMNDPCVCPQKKKCFYGRHLGSNVSQYYCAYLEIEGHKRPSEPNNCNLFKPSKRRRK